MIYNIIFNEEKLLNKDISKIPNDYLKIIFEKIENLSKKGLENSHIRKLNHYYLCNYRLRIGNYRILFDIDEDNKEIVIFRILHRSKLY